MRVRCTKYVQIQTCLQDDVGALTIDKPSIGEEEPFAKTGLEWVITGPISTWNTSLIFCEWVSIGDGRDYKVRKHA